MRSTRLAATLVVATLLAQAAAAQDAAPPPPPSTRSTSSKPDIWLPRPAADLMGLDKITARLTALSVKVGETVAFGTLKITLRACNVRPPDVPADQAAFLDITDTRDPGFSFHRWVLTSDPAVTVVEHPVYDVRLVGCHS